MLPRDVHELARMYQGIMWEHELVQDLAHRGYVHEPEYIGEVVVNIGGREITYRLKAHPDFVLGPQKPVHVIELKTTRWEMRDVINITTAHIHTLERVARYYELVHRVRYPDTPQDPQHTFYLYDPKQFPAFYNVMGQLAVYRSVFGWRRKVKYTLLYVYWDRVHEFDLPDDLLRNLYETYIMQRLPLVAYALYLAENVGWNRWIPPYLVVLDISTLYGYLGYIANDTLAVKSQLTLPIPPIVTPRNENYYAYQEFDAFWGINLRRRIRTAEEVFEEYVEKLADAYGISDDDKTYMYVYFSPGPECFRDAKSTVYRYLYYMAGMSKALVQTFVYSLNLPDPYQAQIVKPPTWFGVRRSPAKTLKDLEEEVESKLRALEEALRG
ncbi:hypothetical protein DRP04_10395 [Archaeoglobales archaeon]|nr:MAG: hypothetical protein DRP04_10395 [Archaeoglobales archaeon]